MFSAHFKLHTATAGKRKRKSQAAKAENKIRRRAKKTGQPLLSATRRANTRKKKTHVQDSKVSLVIETETKGTSKRLANNIRSNNKSDPNAQSANTAPPFPACREQQQKKVTQKGNKAMANGGQKYPYKVDYCDHFETSTTALENLVLLLRRLAAACSKDPESLVIYDPYFCKGAVKQKFASLGFRCVINRKRDFYKDVADGAIPAFDVLVTNPPFSGTHKERALEYAMSCGRPYCLLLPNYVATKEWFRSATRTSCPLFLVPSLRYEFDHPEGTGHAESPFFSMWFIGGISKLQRSWLSQLSDPAKKWAVISSVQGLQNRNLVRSTKRPNPRQRKKMRRKRKQAGNKM